MTTTIFAPALDLTCKVLKSYGIDPEPLLREQNIDPASIVDTNVRVSKKAMNSAWEKAAVLIAEPGFGLRAANHLHPSHLGALGYAWLASTSLRTALTRVSRYVHFVADDIEVDLEEKGDLFIVTVAEAGTTDRSIWGSDSSLAILVALCRMNYGEKFTPVSVEFRHAAPEDTGGYFGFFRCPVLFGCNADRINLSRKVVDERLPSANPQLAQLSDQVMIQTLGRLSRERIVPRVKSIIIDLLPSGNVSDEQVAAELNMSTRALQRKLNRKDTTFKQILTEIRQELADKYIRNNQLSLTEISFMLGFSEVSSFSRAFKRWTGESPSGYRNAV